MIAVVKLVKSFQRQITNAAASCQALLAMNQSKRIFNYSHFRATYLASPFTNLNS